MMLHSVTNLQGVLFSQMLKRGLHFGSQLHQCERYRVELLFLIENVSHAQRSLLLKFSKYTVGILLARERKMVDGYNYKML